MIKTFCNTITALLLCGGSPFSSQLLAQTPSPSGSRIVKVTSLGSVESIQFSADSNSVKRFWVSPDGRRFAREVDHGAKLMVDGKIIDRPIKEDCFLFSPDSKRYAFVSTSDRGETLVVDGKELGTYSAIPRKPQFSPDSQHLACFATKLGDPSERRCVVIDTEAGEASTELGWDLAFEGDSQSVLYSKSRESSSVVVRRPVAVGSKVSELSHGVAELKGSFFFGPKGQVGYVAKFADHQYGVIYDGRDDGQRLVDIQRKNIVVSLDGKEVAYFGDCSPIKNAAVHRGKRGMEFNPFENGRIVDETIQISPDGSRIGYVVEKDKSYYCVVDGKPGPMYQGVNYPGFSPDSQHVAYIAMKGASPVIVIDGKESQQYAMVAQPEFTLDGKSHAYYAELNQKQFMVLNGKRGSEYDVVYKPQFNATGTKLVYSAELQDQNFMMINGQRQKGYSIAGASEFLEEGNRVAYLAVDSKGKERIVVDQSEGETYDRILSQGSRSIYVTSPNSFHYLAVKNKELFLVEETLR